MKTLNHYILDLRNVKCPMNLVLVKQAFFEGRFLNGGKIIIESEVGRKNIIAFLKVKNVQCELKEGGEICIDLSPKL